MTVLLTEITIIYVFIVLISKYIIVGFYYLPGDYRTRPLSYSDEGISTLLKNISTQLTKNVAKNPIFQFGLPESGLPTGGNRLELMWMCVLSEEVLNTSLQHFATSCQLQRDDQHKGFHCVQETPDLIRDEEQSSYASYFNIRHKLMNGNPQYCSRTDVKLQQSFTIHLKNQSHIYAVYILTKTVQFGNGEHPSVEILWTQLETKVCNLCSILPDLFGGTHWIYICPEGAVGEKIHVKDQRKNAFFFQICTIKIFLSADSPGDPEPSSPSYSDERTSTLMPVTENMTGEDPSELEEIGLHIGLSSGLGLCFVFIVIIGVIIIVRRRKRRNINQQPVATVHTYDIVNVTQPSRTPVATPRTLPNCGLSPNFGRTKSPVLDPTPLSTDYDYVRIQAHWNNYEDFPGSEPCYLSLALPEEATYSEASSIQIQN